MESNTFITKRYLKTRFFKQSTWLFGENQLQTMHVKNKLKW